MIDPPRPEAVEAVRKAHEAWIIVIMITGDHKSTALAIAKELRLAVSEANVLSGHQIDNIVETTHILYFCGIYIFRNKFY